ncbi:hypothetical protein [Caulobacter endophyticus]|uniref:hypothetical protein n=1 Tax=Caulobacter endophyticus TaxID=2172652 RepID=UPI002410716F|nr:hypothetical protein [Caulobacter endophyticus]MDG2528443.1 hypothetical protein [Caulobacter endophyticus]
MAQLSGSLNVHLGDEYDRDLRAALLNALLESGATLKDRWQGVGGSQDVSQEEWETADGVVVVEAETYVGLSIQGPEAAVTPVVRRLGR